jgi:hypothetical protein
MDDYLYQVKFLMNQRQNPHQQRLRPIALDVQRSTEVRITKLSQRQPKLSVSVPEISPEIQYLIQLGKAERKHMVQQVQKIAYDNRKKGDLNVSVRTYDLDEVIREFDQPVGAADDEPDTISSLPPIKGQRTKEDEDDITQLQRNTFFYDL